MKKGTSRVRRARRKGAAMQDQALSYGREAFGFIEDVDRLSAVDEVMDAMVCAFGGFGFENLVLSKLPSPEQQYENVMLAQRSHNGWFKVYTKERYFHDDPRTNLLRGTAKPFDWCESLYDANVAPCAAEILGRRRDFGLDCGFVVPSHSVRNTKYFVSMTGHKLDLTAHNKPAIALMALYGLYRVRSLLGLLQREKPLLTPREREVLTWVASGKTAWEIGEILTISKWTVQEYTQNAFHKLGAVNRAQAVAIALRERLIDF